MSPRTETLHVDGEIDGSVVRSSAPSKAWGHSGRVDFNRLDPTLIAVGLATVALFVALQLPWYTYRLPVKKPTGGTSIQTGSASAMIAGGWRYVIFGLALLTIVFLFLESVTSWRRPKWLPRYEVLLGVAAVDVVLVLLAGLVNRATPPHGSGFSITGHELQTAVGAWVALIAAVIAFVAATAGLSEDGIPRLAGVRFRSPVTGVRPPVYRVPVAGREGVVRSGADVAVPTGSYPEADVAVEGMPADDDDDLTGAPESPSFEASSFVVDEVAVAEPVVLAAPDPVVLPAPEPVAPEPVVAEPAVAELVAPAAEPDVPAVADAPADLGAAGAAEGSVAVESPASTDWPAGDLMSADDRLDSGASAGFPVGPPADESLPPRRTLSRWRERGRKWFGTGPDTTEDDLDEDGHDEDGRHEDGHYGGVGNDGAVGHDVEVEPDGPVTEAFPRAGADVTAAVSSTPGSQPPETGGSQPGGAGSASDDDSAVDPATDRTGAPAEEVTDVASGAQPDPADPAGVTYGPSGPPPGSPASGRRLRRDGNAGGSLSDWMPPSPPPAPPL